MNLTANPSTNLGTERGTNSSKMRALLWTLQGLLAALFLFAGAMKFVMPVEEMTKAMPFSGAFLHFIGVVEVLGGLGLVLPGLLHIREGLTPLAAAGLVVIMIGATAVMVSTAGVGQAIAPFVVGLLCAFIAYRRWRMLA